MSRVSGMSTTAMQIIARGFRLAVGVSRRHSIPYHTIPCHRMLPNYPDACLVVVTRVRPQHQPADMVGRSRTHFKSLHHRAWSQLLFVVYLAPRWVGGRGGTLPIPSM